MDHSRATFEAYDGVRYPLPGGAVVECAPLTVAEAVRFLRLAHQEPRDPAAEVAFVAEFPDRLGIVDETLAAIGVEIGDADIGSLTYREAVDLVNLLTRAGRAEDDRERALAQADFLDRFSGRVGSDASPATVMAAGRSLADALFGALHELVGDFYSRQLTTPAELTKTTGSSNSTRGSTT